MPGTLIACRYCGGFHERAAEVRACWAKGSAQGPPSGPPAETEEGSSVDGQASPTRPAPTGPAGPEALGRNLILTPGDTQGDLPAPWQGCEQLDIEEMESVGDRLINAMLAAAHERRRLVLRTRGTGVSPPPAEMAEPWSLGARFQFREDLVSHLVRSNSVELEDGGLHFWLTDRAVALGASAGSPADVVLPDGTAAWCDGGPLRFFDASQLDGAALVHRICLEHGSLRPLGSNATSSALSDDQIRAVCEPGGAARIIAPAGSGKTRVLTERARHLVADWGIPPSAVCMVAYNNRAAEEMRQRCADVPGLQVRTLNSLALAIVNGTPPFPDRRKRRQTIDEPAVRELLDGLVELPRRVNTDPAAAWIEAMSAVRLGLRPPADVEKDYDGDVAGLTAIFPRYRSLLHEQGVLDFDEQIYQAIEILLREPDTRRAAQRACRILLVDEFQDLTPAHVLLVRLVAGPDGAVFGVGDDDQTIYGYADASPRWLIDFAGLFPGAAEHALAINYRCPPSVVAAADRLLRRNRLRITKALRAPAQRAGRGEDLVVVGEGTTGEDAVAATTASVQRLLHEHAAPKNIAVLSRVNAALVPVAVALLEAGVPVSLRLDESWLRRSGVAAALAWLRLARNADQLGGDDLRLAMKRPPRGISAATIDRMANQVNLKALDALARRATGREGPKMAAVVTDLRILVARVRAGATTSDLLGTIRDDLGLDGAMRTMEASRRRLDGPVHTDDLDALVALGRLHPDPATFEAWLHARLRTPFNSAGVHLSTVHPVKGREWPHVVVHGATVGLMPHRLAGDIEEERRVFHVAITRGISSVTVSCGDPPSPFVAELFREPADDPPERPAPMTTRPKAPPLKGSLPGGTPVRPTGRTPERIPASEPPDGDETPVALGQTISAQGYQGVVERVEAEGIRMRVEGASVFVPWRAAITIGRLRTRLGRPPADAPRQALTERLLRQWRQTRVGGSTQPEAVISDAILEAIAAATPVTLAQLAAVKGLGPGRLERYGDEILAIVAEALDE